MNGMSWGSLKHSVPYTHKKPCTISMIIMDGEHYVTVDWITLKVCGWACVCALRFWQVTLGSSFTQFHEGIILWVPQYTSSKLGPPAITWILFWETSLSCSYAQSPAHLSVVQPALVLSLEELCRLPPTHWLWLDRAEPWKARVPTSHLLFHTQ